MIGIYTQINLRILIGRSKIKQIVYDIPSKPETIIDPDDVGQNAKITKEFKMSLFRIRYKAKCDHIYILTWGNFRSWVASFLNIIDGLIEVITLNFIISDISIKWLCNTRDHIIKKNRSIRD